MTDKTTYIFDIDGTLDDPNEENIIKDYTNVTPDENMIKIVNYLYDQGHEIILMTGRGGNTGIDWKDITKKQLKEWGLKYHELRFIKKPEKYVYVDDMACSPEEFLNRVEL